MDGEWEMNRYGRNQGAPYGVYVRDFYGLAVPSTSFRREVCCTECMFITGSEAWLYSIVVRWQCRPLFWEVEREDPDRIVVVVLSGWSVDRLCCPQAKFETGGCSLRTARIV